MPKVNFKGRIRFQVMDSPESTKPTTTTTTIAATIAATNSSLDPVAVQDSPISSYISNLSPLKPVKAAPVAQGFPGLNSPPLVFTSPRIHPHRQSSFLKRPQCTRSSSSELSQQDDRAINVAKGVDESGKSDTKLSCGLIFGTEEGDNSSSVDDQCGSPPGCVDEFLADHVEVDCVDLNHSKNLTSKQSDYVPKSSSSVADSRDSITEMEKKYDVTKDDRMTLGASPAIFDQAVEKCQEKSPFDTAPDKAEKEKEVGDMPSIPCPKVEHHDHALDKHYYEHSVTEDTGAGQKVESDCSSQLLLESMQIVEEYKDCVQATRALSSEPVENMMLHDPKASPHHCGMRRRCLQFEGAQENTTVNSPGSWIPSNSTTSSRSSVIPANSEFLESYCLDVPATPANMQLDNMTQPTFLAFSPRNDGTCSSKVSKPSGIGLHLNSIVNAMPAGFGAIASIKSAERGYLSVRGKKSVSMINRHLSENLENCLISSNVVESTTGSKEDGRHESHPSVAASTARSLSHYSVQPLTNAVLLKPIEQQATACGDKRKSNSGHAESLEECNQSSPKKKRKKSSVTNDGDDCKRCNCKKTKCLKLYCDCFAAGIYCAETCACQECFNRPEYEDTVLETREQIETRNPLAFAPKVIQRNTEPQANSTVEGGIISTPSSARHKRGCNCKKSMCLKKYCECYQGNVGCSDGCRCEGCKNVYGRKEEYGMSKDVVNKQAIDERLDALYNERLDMVPSEKGLLHIELCNPHDLTPLTPSFQSSKYHPSPESDPTFLESYGKSFGSPLNSDNHGMTLETGHRVVLSNHSSMDIPSLMSPMTRDWSNGSGAQLVPGSGHFSSVSSLQWCNSPVTPMTRFGGTKFVQVLDSDDNLHDIVEDDTPEILKEVSTSPNAVKVSSPNKKRVSPPKGGLHELGSSSSAGLRTSRKFILQAVPSFPPLTPCLDSKSSDIQSTSDLQGCSSTK